MLPQRLLEFKKTRPSPFILVSKKSRTLELKKEGKIMDKQKCVIIISIQDQPRFAAAKTGKTQAKPKQMRPARPSPFIFSK